jgi:ribose transport system permease protein
VNAKGLDPGILFREFFLRFGALVLILAIVIYLSFATSTFLTAANFANILSNSSVLMIAATGLCFVVVAGGIDLSIAAAMDIGAMVSIMLLRNAGLNWLLCVFAGLLAGALLSLFNSFMVLKAKVAVFITTLGSLYIGESIEKILTLGGEPIYYPKMSKFYLFLGRGSLFAAKTDMGRMDFKFSVLLAVLIAIAAHFVLSKSSFGRGLKSIGTQKDAARLAGVPVERYMFFSFLACSVICAFAGMVSASVLASYVPLNGRYYLIDAIGAVFIGSTLHKNGHASIPGAAVGVLLFSVISSALNLLGVAFNWQNVAKGLLIFIILAIDAYRKNSQY